MGIKQHKPLSAHEITDIKIPHRAINRNLGSILQLQISYSHLGDLGTTATTLQPSWHYISTIVVDINRKENKLTVYTSTFPL